MARLLLPFVPKPTPAKANLARLDKDLQVLRLIDPAALTYLEHLAADLRTRAELSARVVRVRYLVLWIPLLLGV